MKKRVRAEFVKRNRILLALVLFALVVSLFFTGVMIYSYVRFFVGNDIIVRLESSEKDLFLLNGESKEVSFKMKSLASPFCSMRCEAVFYDLSKGYKISEEKFKINPNEEEKRFFNISAEGYGKAQELYRFSVSCNNLKSLFCHTNEKLTTRNVLLTLNRDINLLETELKRETKTEIEKNFVELKKLNEIFYYLNYLIAENNKTLFVNISEDEISQIESETLDLEKDIDSAIGLWREERYNEVRKELDNYNVDFIVYYNNFSKFNKTIFEYFNDYNILVEKIDNFSSELKFLSAFKHNLSNSLEIEGIINYFNRNVKLFEKELEKKRGIVEKIYKNDLRNFYNLSYLNETLYSINVGVEFDINKKDILFNLSDFEFGLEEPETECCIDGKCESCCLRCVDKNYPVLFLHGHDFEEDISAEYSVNIFDKLQKNLEEKGYVNAGEIYSSYKRGNFSGILGMVNAPLSFRGSYYFDSFFQSEGYVPVQTKSENIDTYSIRLKELIDEVKYETGKNKIIIVAHSMGGLVARRYVQIFGDDNVDKIILIAVPNKGIEGRVKSYCSIFGAELECRDMSAESLFINKLNTGNFVGAEIYNIVGSGCEMDLGDGDGIVLLRNGFLERSRENFVVNGSCSGVNLLHGEILDTDKHPSVLKKINELLE